LIDSITLQRVHRICKTASNNTFTKLQGDREKRGKKRRDTQLILTHASAIQGVLDNHEGLIEILADVMRKLSWKMEKDNMVKRLDKWENSI
jgi:hypothetical protein